ncbi:PREDICTED: aminopeptidase N [Nicrophorus vespilloides]|uniref:Aminopeptidase n=1 Tax=Nicrophorus vespilloides TaxID=110193 RepID=A0ABM1MHU8_NICVS|nr:PREDICTED: aminopeptidase N [Nicrophorus vespilloides]
MNLTIRSFVLLSLFLSQSLCVKRSIDLIAAHGLISDNRLPRNVVPTFYKLEIQPIPETRTFKGTVWINMTWVTATDEIVLHADEELEINEVDVTQYVADDLTTKFSSVIPPNTKLKIKDVVRLPKKPMVIKLEKKIGEGTQSELYITYNGKMNNETSEGLFMHNYDDPVTGESKWYIASHLRPNLARSMFPCFDEPAFKVPFLVSIARYKNMNSLSNMPLEWSEASETEPKWVWDHFRQTPPMSTFTVGVVVTNFPSITYNSGGERERMPIVRVFARPDFLLSFNNTTLKVARSLKIIQKFWGTKYPLPKLDCLALPNYQAIRPADNWGLILFKESEMAGKKTWHISQELVYQWLGSLATPYWWSDAHVNNALARYLTAYTTQKINDGHETFNNWPMTMLYSIYYEFSKRYPHGKSTAIKQDSASAKTELIFRMLNYTLGEKTFRAGLQKFMSDRQYKTFFSDDIWSTLTTQARNDNVLDTSISVNEIAASWITKDRLPVLNVVRDYENKTAKIEQRVYLRERPHDVPDQDKFLWWIPLVMVREDKLNFGNSTPMMWIKKEKEIVLNDMPVSDMFIIINPEEIGPFPVNYDNKNWNMLAQYLMNDDVRTKVPVNTRAKLLHDAWNLAYAGDLCFGTALNMTLFLKYEREYLAWDPVFTMIDHIGRHIDSSEVHQKFQTYVRLLLTPLYEELGNEPEDGETEGRAHLRSSSKVFLCQAGYKPCIEEAQAAFKKWMQIGNPDEGNPVANQYICPVFKWGTKAEWEFGLQRIINFPESRKANERTYLLKTLAGCPIDSWKIEKLLNITVLQENRHFTDNDIYLIFSMLTGGANGYTTLFNFLDKNWKPLKARFEKKAHLWNSLITSATSVFKTQEGLDMVAQFYLEKQGEFGTADFVVEKALKNIKEESKWSTDNLPVIEKWLDDYLKFNQA